MTAEKRSERNGFPHPTDISKMYSLHLTYKNYSFSNIFRTFMIIFYKFEIWRENILKAIAYLRTPK